MTICPNLPGNSECVYQPALRIADRNLYAQREGERGGEREADSRGSENNLPAVSMEHRETSVNAMTYRAGLFGWEGPFLTQQYTAGLCGPGPELSTSSHIHNKDTKRSPTLLPGDWWCMSHSSINWLMKGSIPSVETYYWCSELL